MRKMDVIRTTAWMAAISAAPAAALAEAPSCHAPPGRATVIPAVTSDVPAPGFADTELFAAGFALEKGAVGPDHNITVMNFSFTPADLTVEVGDVVRWTNMDPARHSVTSQSGPDIIMPSGLFHMDLLPNQTFEFQFNTVGDVWYFCTPHGAIMQGVIRVRLTGDVNCDGIITVADIGPFVLALTDPAGYAAQFPNCDIAQADINNDGVVTVADIGPFVALLTGP